MTIKFYSFDVSAAATVYLFMGRTDFLFNWTHDTYRALAQRMRRTPQNIKHLCLAGSVGDIAWRYTRHYSSSIGRHSRRLRTHALKNNPKMPLYSMWTTNTRSHFASIFSSPISIHTFCASHKSACRSKSTQRKSNEYEAQRKKGIVKRQRTSETWKNSKCKYRYKTRLVLVWKHLWCRCVHTHTHIYGAIRQTALGIEDRHDVNQMVIKSVIRFILDLCT